MQSLDEQPRSEAVCGFESSALIVACLPPQKVMSLLSRLSESEIWKSNVVAGSVSSRSKALITRLLGIDVSCVRGSNVVAKQLLTATLKSAWPVYVMVLYP
jgi:hypothetical protein